MVETLYKDLFMEDLLVGTENYTHTGSEELLPGDILTGSAELAAFELGGEATKLNNFVKAADAIGELIEEDNLVAGGESYTAESIARSNKVLNDILELGLNGRPNLVVGRESIAKNVSKAFKVGREAKESKFKEIIRKAKDFIKGLITKIKEYGKRIAASFSTVLLSAKKLADGADELDASGKLKISKDEDKSLHDKLIKHIGMAYDQTGVVDSIEMLNEYVGYLYGEIDSSDRKKFLTDLKGKNAADFIAGRKKDVKKEIDSISYSNEIKPATSAARKLIGEQDVMVAINITVSPKGTAFTSLINKGKKKLDLKIKAAKVPYKYDANSFDEEITNDKIKELVAAVVANIEKYNPQDVITAVYDRIRSADEAISEESKNSKSKLISPLMKYTAYENKLAADSVSAVIETLKASYDVARLLIKNAG